MHIKTTTLDERLDHFESMEDDQIFLCGRRTNRFIFHNRVVASLMQTPGITHALLIFEKGISAAKAKQTTRRIGRTLESLRREMEIDVLYDVASVHFKMLGEENDL